MTSTANMTLEDLARELPRLQELAKSLWGEYESSGKELWMERPDSKTWRVRVAPPKNLGWEHHLQQIVIAKNPIKYLGENLDAQTVVKNKAEFLHNALNHSPKPPRVSDGSLAPLIKSLIETGKAPTCKHGADPSICKYAKFINGNKVCK